MNTTSARISFNALIIYLVVLLLITPIIGLNSLSLKRILIWFLGVPISGLIFTLNYNKLKRLPNEYLFYGSMMVFSLLGLHKVSDMNGFIRYFQVLFANLMLMITVFLAIRSIMDFNKIIRLIFLSVSLIVIISFVMELSKSYSSISQDRLEGILGNSNGTATYARVGVALGLYILQIGIKRFYKVLLWIIIAFLSYAILLTASRGNFVNVLFIFIAFFYFDKFREVKLSIYLVSVSLILIVLGATALQVIDDFFLYERLTQNQASSVEELQQEEARLRLYYKALDATVENPFLGVGLNQFKYYSGGHISHTDFLDISSQLGLGAMFVYMSIYYRLYYKFRLLLRRCTLDIGLRVLFILFLSEIVFGLSNPNWFQQMDMIILSLFLVYTTIRKKSYVRT